MHMHHILAALGDPTRFAIVETLLAEGEKTAGDLAQPFAMSKPAISRHLRVLESAGLIERRSEAQFRMFRARPDTLRRMDEWLAQYRAFWFGSFDRLDSLLQRKSAAPSVRAPEDDEGEKLS